LGGGEVVIDIVAEGGWCEWLGGEPENCGGPGTRRSIGKEALENGRDGVGADGRGMGDGSVAEKGSFA